MEPLIVILVGALFGGAAYMMLQRSLFDLVIGFSLMFNGVNLVIFVVGGLVRADPPIIPPDGTTEIATDPLSQALILTAIVITFGVQAFSLALFHRAHVEVDSDRIEDLEGEA